MKSVNTTSLKKFNRNSLYKYIYKNKTVNKNMICSNLNMCLSTVNTNIKSLQTEGLILKNGSYESTGGRKSDIIQINLNYKNTIGISILKNHINIVQTNLYCEVINKKKILIKFENTEQYFISISSLLNNFIKEYNILEESILGVSFATQGIVLNDNVTYSKIMGNSLMSKQLIEKYFNYNINLEHDSKCAAWLALWHENIKNGYVFLLNNNLGSATIINSEIIGGLSGTIEHYDMNNDNPCYCGKTGCLETMCSINSLVMKSSLPLDLFMQEVRNNNTDMLILWQEFLISFAKVITNIMYVIEGKVILIGELSSYLIQDDLNYMFDYIKSNYAFDIREDLFVKFDFGEYTQAIGSTLYFIKKFINTI